MGLIELSVIWSIYISRASDTSKLNTTFDWWKNSTRTLNIILQRRLGHKNPCKTGKSKDRFYQIILTNWEKIAILLNSNCRLRCKKKSSWIHLKWRTSKPTRIWRLASWESLIVCSRQKNSRAWKYRCFFNLQWIIWEIKENSYYWWFRSRRWFCRRNCKKVRWWWWRVQSIQSFCKQNRNKKLLMLESSKF